MTNIDGTTEPSQLNQEKRRKFNVTTHLQNQNPIEKKNKKKIIFSFPTNLKLPKNKSHRRFNKEHKNPTKTTTVAK